MSCSLGKSTAVFRCVSRSANAHWVSRGSPCGGFSSAAAVTPAGAPFISALVSKKSYCSVPPLWDLAEYSRHRCDDYSHKHLSHGQVTRCEREGRVRWLRRPDREGRGGVLMLTAAPAARGHLAAPVNRIIVRGTSCRVGEALAVAVARGDLWARVMLADIALRVGESGQNFIGGESS